MSVDASDRPRQPASSTDPTPLTDAVRQQAVIVVFLPTATPEFIAWATGQIESTTEFWEDECPLHVYASRDEAAVAHITREFGWGGNDAC